MHRSRLFEVIELDRLAQIVDEVASNGDRRYRVSEVLDDNGHRVLAIARDVKLQRDVEIRIFGLGQERITWPREKNEHQAKVAARLAHPNIARIYDVHVDDTRVCIVSELVQGVSLRDWLADKARDSRQIVELFIQIAKGLAAAHAGGVVHGSLSPSSIVVERGPLVRIVGLGLDGLSVADQDATRHIPQSYRAPELLTGDDTDERSDAFSFSLLLVEALTGHLPRAETGYDIGRDMPAGVLDLVRRGLIIDPQQRNCPMHEVVDALGKVYANKRKIWKTVIVTMVMVVGGGAALWNAVHDNVDIKACRDEARRADTVWTDAQKNLQSALATLSYQRLQGNVGSYLASWRRDSERVCLVRKSRPRDAVALGQAACMELALESARGMVQAFDPAKTATYRTKHVSRAISNIAKQSHAHCLQLDDKTASTYLVPNVQDDKLRALHREIVANRLFLHSHHPKSRMYYSKLRKRTNGLAYLPTRAEALWLIVRGFGTHSSADLVGLTSEAAQLGSQVGNQRIVAEAAIMAAKRGRTEHRLKALASLLTIAKREVARAGDPPSLVAETLQLDAHLHMVRGSYALAIASAEKAVKLLEVEDGESWLRPIIRAETAVMYGRIGAFGKAVEAATAAYRLAKASRGRNDSFTARLGVSLSGFRLLNGDLDGAEKLAQENLEIQRVLAGDNRLAVAEALLHMARVNERREDYAQAIVHNDEAIRICRDLKDGSLLAAALSNRADLSAFVGEFEQAVGYAREAVALADELVGRDSTEYLMALNTLAFLVLETDRPQAAYELFGELRTGAENVGREPSNTAAAYKGLCTSLRRLRRLDEARAACVAATEVYQTAEMRQAFRHDRGGVYARLALVQADLKELDGLRRSIGQAESLLKDKNDHVLLFARARLAWLQGDRDGARKTAQAALDLLQEKTVWANEIVSWLRRPR